jgi:hypothetical protein
VELVQAIFGSVIGIGIECSKLKIFSFLYIIYYIENRDGIFKLLLFFSWPRLALKRPENTFLASYNELNKSYQCFFALLSFFYALVLFLLFKCFFQHFW